MNSPEYARDVKSNKYITNGIRTAKVHHDIFKYYQNAPTVVKRQEEYIPGLYKITRIGDLLLYIYITGKFTNARLFQYDSDDNIIIYDEISSSGIMQPFVDGIPLLQCGKNFYIEIEDGQDIIITARYICFIRK